MITKINIKRRQKNKIRKIKSNDKIYEIMFFLFL